MYAEERWSINRNTYEENHVCGQWPAERMFSFRRFTATAYLPFGQAVVRPCTVVSKLRIRFMLIYPKNSISVNIFVTTANGHVIHLFILKFCQMIYRCDPLANIEYITQSSVAVAAAKWNIIYEIDLVYPRSSHFQSFSVRNSIISNAFQFWFTQLWGQWTPSSWHLHSNAQRSLKRKKEKMVFKLITSHAKPHGNERHDRPIDAASARERGRLVCSSLNSAVFFLNQLA